MKLTLDDVYEHLEDRHKYTGYIMGLCPFHDDHSPSLQVTEKGYWCKSCLAHGSLEKLYENISGRVVIKEKVYNQSALIWRKWEEKFGSIPNIAKVAHNNLKQNPDLGHYLVTRKVDEFIKVGMFGYLDAYYLFPIKNEYGEIDGIVARASPSIQTKNNRYTVSKDCKEKLYVPNWQRVFSSEEIYVCYGILDALTLYKAGYASVTGISGKELNSINLDRFRKPMWIVPDKNEEVSAMELQRHLGWRMNTLRVNWSDGCKDLNDVYMKNGIDSVSKIIQEQKETFNYV